MSSNLQRLGGDAVVTKRKPGAVIGRPRKAAVPKLPSGATGRPFKPIETDPNRYLYVEIQSLISYHEAAATGKTANKVAETVIAGHYGTPVTTETIIGPDKKPLDSIIGPDRKPFDIRDNIKAMAEGRPYMVYAPERVGLLGKKKTRHYDAKWRNKNIFRPAADDVLHKLRALRAERNLWLMTMDALMNICWSGASEDPAVVECCRQMADSIGERRIFEKKLLPQLRSSTKLRKAGAPGVQLVPGFLSSSLRAKGLGKTGKQ